MCKKMGRVNVIETVYFLYFLIYSISLGRTSKFATTAKKKKTKIKKHMFIKLTTSKLKTCLIHMNTHIVQK